MPSVPVRKTPVSMADFARAVVTAWRSSFAKLPSKETAATIYAQYGLETGAGGYCWNHNAFNWKISDSQVAAGVPYTMLANTWEMVNGKKVVFQPPHRATWFRAFESLSEAMDSHLHALRKGRYARAWPAIEVGNPVGVARALGNAGYFTADPDAYARGMLTHYERFLKATAYEDAVRAVVAAQDAETARELPDVASEPEPAIVHPRVPLGRPALDGEDDDDGAA